MANSMAPSKKEKIIKGIKTVGSIIMYIGSSAIMVPSIQKARETQNGLMGSCAVGTGAMISVGMGKVASGIFNKVVDKTVDFWDDVKHPKEKEHDDDIEEDEE